MWEGLISMALLMGVAPQADPPAGLSVGPGELTVVLGDQATAVEERGAGLFAAAVKWRTGQIGRAHV